MKSPLLCISTLDDLNRVLSLKQIIVERTRVDLDALAESLAAPTTQVEEYQYGQIMLDRGKQLLERYAKLMTLSEFGSAPNLGGERHWGATFSVALVMGELVLRHIRALEGTFEKEHRKLVTLLMRELDLRTSENLVDTLAGAITVNFSQQNLTEHEQRKLKMSMLNSLVEAMLLVLSEYGLVDNLPGVFRLTRTGKRVLLHMNDAQGFIEILASAHSRLRDSEPKKLQEAVAVR